MTIWKDPDAGKDWGQEEKGTTEDEMAGWHHWLDGHGFGWTPGVGDGQGGLACCGSWGRKESDTTEWLNWTDVTLKLTGWSGVHGTPSPQATACNMRIRSLSVPDSLQDYRPSGSFFPGLPRQEYWSGLPFPTPGQSSQPRDRTHVSCIAGRFFYQ